jgi:competence protein ComGF
MVYNIILMFDVTRLYINKMENLIVYNFTLKFDVYA